MFDYIIIGAGYGGISIAALLAKYGFKTLVIESHSKIGGCASYFRRKGFTFDAGATTFSALSNNRPVGILFKELEITPKFKKMDIGTIVKLRNTTIKMYSDKSRWIEHAVEIFENKDQRKFWSKIYKTEETIWNLIEENYLIPPKNFSEILSGIRFKNLQLIDIIPYLFTSVKAIAKNYNLDNINFLPFLDEQLLITSQNRTYNTPFAIGAMGLSYSTDTYYPYGGMYKPADEILNKFKLSGGEIILREKVDEVSKIENGYLIKTNNGNEYNSKGVISSIPTWNLAKITKDKYSKFFGSLNKDYSEIQSAFTLYFAVEYEENLETNYFQIHTKRRIPFCNSDSFFVSFSDIDDIEKAPYGFKTVTISLHTNPNNWLNLTDEEYLRRKSISVKAIIEEFNDHFEILRDKEKLHLTAGTAKTFQHYTKRMNGLAGGIPHSIKRNIILMPGNRTPFDNFYLVGDTVFPGQGTPAVILGALNTFKRIKNETK